MDRPALTDILFLDIETVAGSATYNELPERLQAQWDRKAKFIKTEEAMDSPELYVDRAGIFAEFGKIVTVAVGFLTPGEDQELQLRVKAFFDHDERVLLEQVVHLFTKGFDPKRIYLCGHNIKEFDIPYMCRRMLVNGLTLPDVLDIAGKKPWETRFLDTLELWKFGDFKHFTSLELLATIFGLDSSKSDIDGSQVNEVYYGEEEGLERIAHYCRADVLVTTNLYLKMRGEDIITEEQVVMV
ncbi:MAG TPA: 3'-5' exonuclease [Cytophagales bacterium]|nr:3'-5' exonuclease [Cytophagales bacterium]